MPLQFECCFESTKVLSLHTNGDNIIHLNVEDKLSGNQDNVISISLHYEEVELLIKEMEKKIKQIKINNIKKTFK